MNMHPIKVVYICTIANKDIHSHLPLKMDMWTKLLYKKNHFTLTVEVKELAVWNTNFIELIQQNHKNVELHVIAPYKFLKTKTFEYEQGNIHYHFFRSDDENLLRIFIRRIMKVVPDYHRNRKIIKRLIAKVQPDIVHIVGAENPQYALSALDVSKRIPLIVQLQTLMNDERFRDNYEGSNLEYKIRANYEYLILKRADYIGTSVDRFKEKISSMADVTPSYVNFILALAEKINLTPVEIKYDFVYFAADISKAADYAIEAFILASKQHPGITLDIIGGYSLALKQTLESRLRENGIEDKVKFEGMLPSHDDVLEHIRYSRFALLPLKIDLVSGTIRESLANGLPVLTTITPGTPKINAKRETVLLSAPGDHQALADNMCRILEDVHLQSTLRDNGVLYMKELKSNSDRVAEVVSQYYEIIDTYKN